ncbi:MAG TPA: aspartate carbamoyltransferase [Tenuifilaceae bacterium]|nr:aspartate carbamoyltransferase [Tenuifilaceae bacterium]HOG71246.1 aspartate carbamoyltransferase [Tenuifilaceae bacterium]HOW20969.1 aspartate carbamoyltransferase [Tenuifilaceae bacterium]HPA66881.1 aspartate carbamoyltransferase [Tenuifilaceae bacterium]HPS05209.1 aspartate carbamoyltransferase [Tenuifilaceae bacterium]
MKSKSLVSINDLSRDEMLRVLDLAEEFERNPSQPILQGKVVATLFFEPSTRTRLSFESAVNRLSGRVIGFSEASSSSVSKGESLKDTILTVANYSDLIVMRHPVEGSARYASEVSPVPIINAGDGANQHPTQTLLDLYSIRKTQGTLNDLKIVMVGDLKYGRTVHSLLMAISQFNASFVFIAPPELQMPQEYKLFLKESGLKFEEHTDLADNIVDADIVYMTRVQRERFSDPMEYEKVKNVYVLRNHMLANTKPNMKVMHPLPRVNEISIDVDDSSKAYYFTQALNGVYTRMAIMSLILGLK